MCSKEGKYSPRPTLQPAVSLNKAITIIQLTFATCPFQKKSPSCRELQMSPLDLQLKSLGAARNNNDLRNVLLLNAKNNLNKKFIDQYSPIISHQLSL